MNLKCWWKGHNPIDLFKGTEMEGVNVYCKRCHKPIGSMSWMERYYEVTLFLAKLDIERKRMRP